MAFHSRVSNVYFLCHLFLQFLHLFLRARVCVRAYVFAHVCLFLACIDQSLYFFLCLYVDVLYVLVSFSVCMIISGTQAVSIH